MAAVIALRTLCARTRRIIGADPRDRRGNPAPGSVVPAVARGDPRRDGLWPMTADARERIKREQVELKRCLALLAEAIARAERWYARQEAELAAFDRRTGGTVNSLRAGGWVDPSLAWHPRAARHDLTMERAIALLGPPGCGKEPRLRACATGSGSRRWPRATCCGRPARRAPISGAARPSTWTAVTSCQTT